MRSYKALRTVRQESKRQPQYKCVGRPTRGTAKHRWCNKIGMVEHLNWIKYWNSWMSCPERFSDYIEIIERVATNNSQVHSSLHRNRAEVKQRNRRFRMIRPKNGRLLKARNDGCPKTQEKQATPTATWEREVCKLIATTDGLNCPMRNLCF